jgi:serine/threonine protein phosphatase PrpC
MSDKSESKFDARSSRPPLDETPPPFSSRVNVDFFGMSEKGQVRTNNEDHFLLVRVGRAVETVLTNLSEAETLPGELFEETGYGMVLADGVGGEAAGEVASRQAIYTLLSLALHTPDWQFRWGAKEKNTVLWRMRDRFRRINAALLRNADADPRLTGMCTTMTAAVIHGNGLIIGHMGDSRAYLLHHGKLIQLTRDHTVGERLVEDGTHTPSDPLVVELRGLLLKALGSREGECEPDVYDCLLENNDQLLLCTDGLTDMVDDVEIETIMNGASSAESACRKLVDQALGNGGRDNVTVIVARYSLPVQ